MNLSEGEFHATEGWIFKRNPKGWVQVSRQFPGDDYGTWQANFPASVWASIVAHVSARGETAETYRQAFEFHNEQAQEQHPPAAAVPAPIAG